MNKLQLYIYKSLRGFKSLRNINPSGDVQRHIREMRKALEILSYDPAEKYLFYLISYIDEGAFFSILRTIPDQPLDHLATTIFVPNGLKISRDEMAEVVKRTTRTVSNPSVSAEELSELHELFAREYDCDPQPPAAFASEGREYAFCYYGGDTGRQLADFFADKLYQPDFLKYAGVVLVDADLEVVASGHDLSAEKLAEIVTLLPPQADADGFTPHVYRHTLNRPFRVPLGAEVTVTWRRSGFEDQTQTITIDSDTVTVPPISNADSKKVISPSSFYITSQTSREPVEGVAITVNGRQINGPVHFTLSELKNAEVQIDAEGFAPFRAHFDLAATTQALVQLREHRKIFRFEMPVITSELGAPIHFEIHTKRELHDSPIEGYALRDDQIREGARNTNYLYYCGGSTGFSLAKLIGAAAAALVVGFLLGWLCTGSSSASSDTEAAEAVEEIVAVVPDEQVPQPKKEDKEAPAEKPAEVAESVPAAPENIAEASADAISYLDSNKKWTREEMEKFPALKGLFDDLDQFRFDRITGKWQSELKKSKTFSKVAFHAGEGAKKKIFQPSGKYCKSGPQTIVVQTYLNTIDPAKK